MKKIFLALAALASMAAVSCVKDEQNPNALVPEPEPENLLIKEIPVKITIKNIIATINVIP